MASPTTYFVAEYDNLAGGNFSELGATLLSWPGSGTGFVITDIPDGTTGKIMVALITGSIPTNNQTLTQGGVTADTSGPLPNGDGTALLYPAYFRRDVELSAAGAYTWDSTAPALEVTHSFLFDGQSTNVVAGEILTFVDGQQCEVITIVSDVGASGELDVRWITPIDTQGLPEDNDTFTGDIAGDGTLNGVVHDRSYSALHIHRLSADLNDDSFFTGDDIMATYKPTPSSKDTDAIINLLGNVTITDEIGQHMYGGSINQGAGDTEKLYSGLNIQITDSDGDTEPVLIQSDAIVTKFWANALNPDSIAGRIRIMLPTRENGADYDGKRVKGRLLRYGDTYFTGSTTLGTATTALALFSATDNNNQTAEGTVAGAPYNTIVQTQGYQTEDYNNGNGATPFALINGFGSATSAQHYERTKYNQREDSSESIFNRNVRLFDGVTLNFAYDNDSGTFNEGSSAELIAWGFEIPYTGQTSNFTVGNVVVGGTSGARGRILADDDNGATGTLFVALDGTTPFNNTEALTELGGGSGDGTSGTVVNNAAAGTAVVLADDATGNNLYCMLTQGVAPADDQGVYGVTTEATADVDAATTLETRVVNNQYIGGYTGSNYLTNHGIGIDSNDAISGDLFPNLLGINQPPPNNQTASITGLEADYYVTCYPWDGSTTDAVGDPQPTFAEMSLNTTITQAVSTAVDVGTGNIPDNTPQSGFLRIERDSDNEYFLWAYTAHDGDDGFTMTGTAPFTATAGNDVMRAPLDEVAGGTSLNFTAVQGTTEQFTITARRGGTVSPIKPAKATATFDSGFTVNIQAQSDV
jgi:hypothetical protein